jgi:beta-phosphoglucomutase family hydrolase
VFTIDPSLAFIFDMDGVIVDSMPMHTLAWEQYLQSQGIDPSNVEKRMHGKRNDDLVRDLFSGHVLDDAQVFEHGAAKERLFRQLIGAEIESKLVPGIREFLRGMNGTPLGIGTNAEPANVDFILDGARIRRYFKAIVDGTQVPKAKPAPDVYLRAAELLGVHPANCVVFEDSAVGIQAARSAGARAVGLLTHADSLADVSLAVRDFLDPELKKWLSSQKPAA